MNLSAYFHTIFGTEKELIWLYLSFGTHLALKEAWVIQYLIVLNNRYQLFFGAHWRTKLLWSKMFGAEQQQSSTEIHPGWEMSIILFASIHKKFFVLYERRNPESQDH